MDPDGPVLLKLADGPSQPPSGEGGGRPPTKNQPTIDLPANLQPPDTNQYSGDAIPPDLKYMMDNGAPPEIIFTKAGQYYKPVVMATITTRPISGGPLLGFEPMTKEGRVLIKAFYSVWYEGNAQTSKFFTWEEAMALKFSCSSTTLAAAMTEWDPQMGSRAHMQVAQFTETISRARAA